MHTFGKVTSVASALVAIVFMMLTASVVQKRVDLQKDLDAEKAKVPTLEADIQTLDRKRIELESNLTQTIGSITALVTLGQNRRSDLEQRQALETDRLNNSEAAMTGWQSSLGDVQSEVTARQNEEQQLTTNVSLQQDDLRTHKDQVADLEVRFAEATDLRQKTETNISQLYDKLQQLVDQMRQNTAAVTGIASGN